MTKVVINTCHGGFGLSAEAERKYRELAGIADADFHSRNIPRDDAHLIAVVELMGETANNRFSELKIVDIPDDVNWYIEEYDGKEWVAERHRTWD
jgi:hypothetical protein